MIQRQDDLTAQMRDVMRYAVDSGCYDAHDWLVERWGKRDGICGDTPEIIGSEPRPLYCSLTYGHGGAHSNAHDERPGHWWKKDT